MILLILNKVMGRRFLLFVGIIFSPAAFFAQISLFGKIIDEKTEAPLGDVLIEYVANSKKKTITKPHQYWGSSRF